MIDALEGSHSKNLVQTPLHALHEALGAKFSPFAGFSMPIEYGNGIRREHLHVRASAGLFDVSHMGQIIIRGPKVVEEIERLVPSDIAALRPFRQRYSVLTNERGGIIDDVMITCLPEQMFIVVNAANVARDLAHITERLPPNNSIELLEDRALLALQGPSASTCLAKWAPGIAKLEFMQAGYFQLGNIECLVHRCGYTGCDGFELSLKGNEAASFASMLLEDDAVEPIGLGARDTLRLEAGLCLAGVDFDADTTPVEAALEWVIARKYRIEPQTTPGFLGATRILKQLNSGAKRKRIGLISAGRAPVRAGAVLLYDGREVGHVTSGSFGPSFGGPIAMGYGESSLAAIGIPMTVEIRGRIHELQITKLPFVPTTYYRS